jgi:hypothetical protein
MSRQVNREEFMEANRQGAFHVLSAPCHPKEVEWLVIQAKRDDRRTTRQLLMSHAVSGAGSEDRSG